MAAAEPQLSYADCFAVATAKRHGAALLTGYREILGVSRPGVKLVDLAAG